MKLLLIEDTAADAAIARHRLGRLDIDVQVAGSWAEAVPLLPVADVVLADLELPDSDGAATIAALARHRPPRWVVFTDDAMLRKQALDAGAQVISKDGDEAAWRSALGL